jgi:hypothetical protein
MTETADCCSQVRALLPREQFFADTVSSKLRSMSDMSVYCPPLSQFHHDFYEGCYMEGEGDMINDTTSSSSAYDLASPSYMRRLENLEQAMHRVERALELIIARIPAQSPQSEAPPASPSVARNASSSSSSPTTQQPRYSFLCPLCRHPQFTPKSHCEHVRKTVTTVAGVNAAVCQFLPPEQSSPASNRIREVFGSASNFVAWYTSHLRSGVGKKFTAADIADYERLQLKLSQALQPTQ